MTASATTDKTRRTRRPNPDDKTLFKRRLVKQWLRNGGRKHAITMAAFKTVTRMGQAIIQKLITAITRELSASARHNRTTITQRHVVHAANFLSLDADLMAEAVDMHKAQRYDASHYKRSAVRKVFAQFSGKNRVSAQAMSLLWCIVILHLQELIKCKFRCIFFFPACISPNALLRPCASCNRQHGSCPARSKPSH
tara:strand:+ start:244 stop:831 length:588 start_codon:yes stop_codon:yes gene_type:complete